MSETVFPGIRTAEPVALSAESPRQPRRRPALPSGYEPPDYPVAQVRLADGRVLHVNAHDLADPRYKNIRNLNPDGTPVQGRAALQTRAVFDGAELLAPPAHGSEYRPEPSPELQQGQEVMRQIHAYDDAKNRAAAEHPTGWDKIKTAVGNAATDMARNAGTVALVVNEARNPHARMNGMPLTRAAGNSALTGLASMGTSANHFLGRFLPEGQKLQGYLQNFRAELDKLDPHTNYRPWLKEQDKMLQQHLPAWYAAARPLHEGPPTTEDIATAGQRGLTQPEYGALLDHYLRTRDPEIWAQIERQITTTPEELAVEQMRRDVKQSEGGQQIEKIIGEGASDNLLENFHPVSIASNFVPARSGYTAVKAMVNPGQGKILRTLAGNVMRSMPEAAGYGALQHIVADPQTSSADLGKGVLKIMAVSGGMTAAGAVVGAAVRRAGAGGGPGGAAPPEGSSANGPLNPPKRIYHVTNNIDEIETDGRAWGQTEGGVYGMTMPDAPRWRTMADLKTENPGTIIFEGQPAELFKPHPVEGGYSGLKRLLGQHKSGFGDIVWDPADAVRNGDVLTVRKARLDPNHQGQTNSRAAMRLWGRRVLENALPPAIAMGMRHFSNERSPAPEAPQPGKNKDK